MGGFSVDRDLGGSIILHMNQIFRERYLIILLHFSGELNMGIYAVEMLVEFLNLVFVF